MTKRINQGASVPDRATQASPRAVPSRPSGEYPSRKAVVMALEWSLGRLNRPRLIPGQNDDYVAAYEQAHAVLSALKGGA